MLPSMLWVAIKLPARLFGSVQRTRICLGVYLVGNEEVFALSLHGMIPAV